MVQEPMKGKIFMHTSESPEDWVSRKVHLFLQCYTFSLQHHTLVKRRLGHTKLVPRFPRASTFQAVTLFLWKEQFTGAEVRHREESL